VERHGVAIAARRAWRGIAERARSPAFPDSVAPRRHSDRDHDWSIDLRVLGRRTRPVHRSCSIFDAISPQILLQNWLQVRLLGQS